MSEQNPEWLAFNAEVLADLERRKAEIERQVQREIERRSVWRRFKRWVARILVR